MPRSVTAAELMSKLNQDADFVRRREERAKHFEALEESYARAERPLVEALNDVAVPVKSVWDLVNTPKTHPQAISILVAHLAHPYPFRIREGIARALTVRNVGDAAFAALVSEFRKLPDSTEAAQHGFKWALGNAISVAADRDRFEEVVGLIRDKRHGTTRDMMTLRLPALDRERAVDVLVELLADDEVAVYALKALAKLKARKARSRVENLLNNADPKIRSEALKTLAKVGHQPTPKHEE
jgi:HEAT repeats